MPTVLCKNCNTERFYPNLMGTNIKGKCDNCKAEIIIPFKSVQDQSIEYEKCKNCGFENRILHILPKKSLSVQTGYRGGSVKTFHGTPEITYKGECEKCGKKL